VDEEGDALDADAAEAGGVGVGADGADVAAEDGLFEEEGGEEGEGGGEPDAGRQGSAGGGGHEGVEAAGVGVDLLFAGEAFGEAAEDAHAAEGDDEGAEAGARGEQARGEASEGSGGDGSGDGGGEGCVGAELAGEDDAGEGDGGADGEVDAA